ncbi:ABC transporter ATP-binding protein [Sinorhizobium fredii USDA 205]|uniref:Dipeptide ABC transporter ATP-binding protein n=1 Tax=Rhizobium fredii TaxID=380 RepID=A0A844ABB9_RHIFR|nr:ABC transporter ATP-binding protein [Sinorhizobium fredii]ASY72638.1 ABC transporter ATP-binding protein [Sinorhizobium fredii CCBAU 83666]KSV85375.1 ABC transporter ATP-binding protein [Sinorhizobium fredii USDA 205]MQW98581.1 dipeptide ABC transporter ATP-binding protein [Sinorhizobium fredii]MQX10474.1 dipeptide ABC transporter ATP-binding protein [Sinorhizobium fredii]GEC34846.1 ABC transporter ATP-binding protein [Sinorhizobium fredii]
MTSLTNPRVPVLEVSDLAISYHDGGAYQEVVHGVSFRVEAGQVVALVGESGSGKTTTAQSIIGLLAANGRVDRGAIKLNGTDISRWSDKQLDTIRGASISLVPQDPGSSLNPVKTIGDQVGEILEIHGKLRGKDLERRVVALLDRVGLSEPEFRARQYPHELSGGMRQRVLIAIAITLKPQLIIADEPTSALDVTVQKRILDLIDELRREYGTAVLLVTHDLGIAADRADRVVVLQGGRVQEEGSAIDVLASPRSAYTRQLIADAPSLARSVTRAPATARLPDESAPADDIVVVEQLVQAFRRPGTGQPPLLAVDKVSFRVRRGTTHALVGESGSGKTTTIRAVVGFQRPTSGTIRVDGTDLANLNGEALRQFRRKIQLVYQNPYASLDPRQTVFGIIEEPLLNFGAVKRTERRAKVMSILGRVGLPEATALRRPHALSGGQRQRVAIARALILEPQVVVLDEAVSALDVTVQARILDLLDELQQDLGLTYLFVSHDLAVVRQIADTVSVLRGGRLVDGGPVAQVFEQPGSDYTRELINAIPGRNHPVFA